MINRSWVQSPLGDIFFILFFSVNAGRSLPEFGRNRRILKNSIIIRLWSVASRLVDCALCVFLETNSQLYLRIIPISISYLLINVCLYRSGIYLTSSKSHSIHWFWLWTIFIHYPLVWNENLLSKCKTVFLS